jgi:hypothetical protein
MAYRIAGVDVHKKMLAVVVSDARAAPTNSLRFREYVCGLVIVASCVASALLGFCLFCLWI